MAPNTLKCNLLTPLRFKGLRFHYRAIDKADTQPANDACGNRISGRADSAYPFWAQSHSPPSHSLPLPSLPFPFFLQRVAMLRAVLTIAFLSVRLSVCLSHVSIV